MLVLLARLMDVLFYDIQMVASVVHGNRMLEGMTQARRIESGQETCDAVAAADDEHTRDTHARVIHPIIHTHTNNDVCVHVFR